VLNQRGEKRRGEAGYGANIQNLTVTQPHTSKVELAFWQAQALSALHSTHTYIHALK